MEEQPLGGQHATQRNCRKVFTGKSLEKYTRVDSNQSPKTLGKQAELIEQFSNSFQNLKMDQDLQFVLSAWPNLSDNQKAIMLQIAKQHN